MMLVLALQTKRNWTWSNDPMITDQIKDPKTTPKKIEEIERRNALRVLEEE